MIKRDYLTPRELAKAKWFPFNSVLTVYKLIEEGKLTALNVSSTGKRYMIHKESIVKYLKSTMIGKIDGLFDDVDN